MYDAVTLFRENNYFCSFVVTQLLIIHNLDICYLTALTSKLSFKKKNTTLVLSAEYNFQQKVLIL